MRSTLALSVLCAVFAGGAATSTVACDRNSDRGSSAPSPVATGDVATGHQDGPGAPSPALTFDDSPGVLIAEAEDPIDPRLYADIDGVVPNKAFTAGRPTSSLRLVDGVKLRADGFVEHPGLAIPLPVAELEVDGRKVSR